MLWTVLHIESELMSWTILNFECAHNVMGATTPWIISHNVMDTFVLPPATVYRSSQGYGYYYSVHLNQIPQCYEHLRLSPDSDQCPDHSQDLINFKLAHGLPSHKFSWKSAGNILSYAANKHTNIQTKGKT